SNTLSLKIIALLAPTATSPSGAIEGDRPIFNWTSVAGAGHYTLVVNDLTSGQTALGLDNLTSTVLFLDKTQALTPGHAFSWQVAAVSADGQLTSWSSQKTFTIAALKSPDPAGLSINASIFLFTWAG